MTDEVFRVEDALGQGPYRGETYTDSGPGSDSRIEYGTLFNDDDDAHPAPYKDDLPETPGDTHPRDYMFGFTSMEALRAWFDGPRRKWLREHGYRLAHYCSDLVLRGLHQLAFLKKTAKRIATEELKDD